MGVKIYAVGIGTNGMADFPRPDMLGRIEYVKLPVVIDEATLQNIAQSTGGKYFRATDEKMLQQVFDEIDNLEKTVLDVDRFTLTDENFMPWLIAALCALGLMLLMRYTILRRIP